MTRVAQKVICRVLKGFGTKNKDIRKYKEINVVITNQASGIKKRNMTCCETKHRYTCNIKCAQHRAKIKSGSSVNSDGKKKTHRHKRL